MPDKKYMRMAIELARKGEGHVNPNPLVGAVIVKDGEIIGEGWHTKYGSLHAEREALAACNASPEGADMYVTLEPCCHQGKQPPCTDAIIESGITRVIIGSRDPNPLVAGKGVDILKAEGIDVVEDFLKAECDAINYVFFGFITTGLPYVVMKYAMTMDGKIATHTGQSRWITGEIARQRVHEDRNRYAAIMVGIGTVIKDDPLLTCRIPGGRDPARIICDTHLRMPSSSQIARTADRVRTIIAACSSAADISCTGTGSTTFDERKKNLELLGCEVLDMREKDGHIDMRELMKRLGDMKIDGILLEGGGSLNWAALESGIVDKIQCYIAPKIFGGREAPSPVGGQGVDLPSMAFHTNPPRVSMVGDDILLESEVTGRCLQE